MPTRINPSRSAHAEALNTISKLRGSICSLMHFTRSGEAQLRSALQHWCLTHTRCHSHSNAHNASTRRRREYPRERQHSVGPKSLLSRSVHDKQTRQSLSSPQDSRRVSSLATRLIPRTRDTYILTSPKSSSLPSSTGPVLLASPSAVPSPSPL